MTDLEHLRFSQRRPANASCGLRASIDLISGKWKPLILWHLLGGPVRFGDLRRAVGTVSEKVLAEQLAQLERAGIIGREVVSETPLAVDYSLTGLGETLVPVLAALSQWGFEHVVNPAIAAESKSAGGDV